MKYPVVYSYRNSRTRELELSLESLKNLKEWSGEVFIIGDKPRFEGNFTYLPVKYDWGKRISPSSDEVCAYLTAADFLDEFIMMSDDIFILKEWSLERQNKGTLTEHANARTKDDSYTRQLTTTRDYLEKNDNTQFSYEMHIPTLVKSERLRFCADIIQRDGKPYLIRSLIGNIYELPSVKASDVKDITITDETVLYSSYDPTFNYEEVRRWLK